MTVNGSLTGGLLEVIPAENFRDSSRYIVLKTRSDQNGRFQLGWVNEGWYWIRFSNSLEKKIYISLDQTLSLAL